ncbi:hypothetical protein QFJ66_00450 [Raoultella terrigena]|uniref:hypothetical protein n=1 Tax=Raoultella terrigena TaxID=577 RepID=UPI002F952B9A
MRGFLLGVYFLLFSCCAFSQSDIVQGPFKLDAETSVVIKNENDVNYPLAIYYEINGNSYKVETYEVDGDDPHVETVFFTNLETKKNVIVLMLWHQKHSAERIDGTAYQVFGYTYDARKLTVNSLIKNDQNLNGFDGGFDGKKIIFRYKNADKIKQYLKLHY